MYQVKKKFYIRGSELHLANCMKRIVAILFLALQMQVFTASATHIVGGELNYRYLGNNNYEIRLTCYRDCYNGVPPFDNPASIGVFDINNNLVTSVSVNFTISDTLAPYIVSPCLIPPSNVCYEKTTYITTINLPPIPGGYQLVYQRCCRNSTILNIVNPLNVGATYNAFIPDPSLTTTNSNPVFNNWPPTFICENAPFTFDHSATDIDGDSLVYVLCDPLDGATAGNPIPQPPLNPPYTPVTWQPPYGPGNLFGGVPLTINSQTGWLTATPNTVGQFVYGVCVQEYRNGNLLSETRRDYQMNVVSCPQIVVASILSPTLACGTLNASFTNNSFGASSYFWDFGVSSVTNDTSNIANPNFTYPDTGTYTAMLVAYSGINPACNDTSWGAVIVYPPLDATFNYQGVPCTNTVMFTDATQSNSGTLNSWSWNFGDNTTSNIQNPTHTYNSPGTYIVRLVVTTNAGCIDTVTMNVDVVNVQPVATFNYTNVVCTGECTFNNQSQWSINFNWNFGDNTTSNAANPTHTYQQPGVYTVVMIASDNSGCADTVSHTVPIVSGPTASFTSSVPPCSLTGTFNNTSNSVTGYNWNFGDGDSSALQNPSHTYQLSGTYNVTLTVSDNNGCTGTTVQTISPYIFSHAAFTYGIDTCAAQVMFTNQSINAEKVLWSFGDGSGSNEFLPVHVYSESGIYPVVLITNPGTICADTLQTDVNYELSGVGNIWVPNAFTPNTDGKNDVFEVFAYYPCDLLTLMIFNRWGQKIYETTGPHLVWDGYFDGTQVEAGIYVYLLKGTYTDKIGSIAVIK